MTTHHNKDARAKVPTCGIVTGSAGLSQRAVQRRHRSHNDSVCPPDVQIPQGRMQYYIYTDINGKPHRRINWDLGPCTQVTDGLQTCFSTEEITCDAAIGGTQKPNNTSMVKRRHKRLRVSAR